MYILRISLSSILQVLPFFRAMFAKVLLVIFKGTLQDYVTESFIKSKQEKVFNFLKQPPLSMVRLFFNRQPSTVNRQSYRCFPFSQPCLPRYCSPLSMAPSSIEVPIESFQRLRYPKSDITPSISTISPSSQCL